MTPYVADMLLELAHDLPNMAVSLPSDAFREAVMFRCSEILSLAPAVDVESARDAIERLRSTHLW